MTECLPERWFVFFQDAGAAKMRRFKMLVNALAFADSAARVYGQATVADAQTFEPVYEGQERKP